MVHLFFESDPSHNLFLFEGDAESPAWLRNGHSWSVPIRLDLYYDLNLPRLEQSDNVAFYGSSDPARAFWRMRFDFDDPLNRSFDISRPTSIGVFENAISIQRFLEGPTVFEQFDFYVPFDAPLSSGLALPRPPLPHLSLASPSYLTMEGTSFFENFEHLGDARMSANFNLVNAEIIPGLSPVPEASTYGVIAVAGLCAAIATRLRRPRLLSLNR